MRSSDVATMATLGGFLAALLAVGSPPDAINPVIGDDSFQETFGRFPTDDDANALRVQTHLAHVERRLRAVDDTALPAQLRAARRKNLDLLRRYWQAELFPAGESRTGRQPTFIDDAGRRCAVAALVEAASGTETVDRINRRFRNAYIAEMDDAALAAWIADSGFTRREVMMIQPTYYGPGEWEVERWQLVAAARGTFLNRLGGDEPSNVQRMAGGDARLQLIDLHYRWLAGAEAAAAGAGSGNTFYRVGLRAGAVPFSVARDKGLHASAVVTAGAAIDGVEGVVPMAVTVPGALLISIDTMGKRSYYETYHELVPWPIVQLRAQGDWVVRGRPQELAWTAGLDLVWRLSRWSSMTGHRFGPRDLIASFTVTEFAGTVYGGLAVGLGAWSLTESVTDHYPNSAPPLLGPYW